MLTSGLCSRCDSYNTIECSAQTSIHPRGFECKITYEIEFTICDNCGEEFIKPEQILRNQEKVKQAKKEATTAYKMKKWLEDK